MTILELRETLVALLNDIAGSYTLPNGTQQAAFWVDGKNGLPKNWKVKGLEVAMRQYPATRTRPLMGTVQKLKTWEVVLSQYDPSSENLETAIDRITRHFPDATVQGFPASDREYQYARLLIPDLDIVFQYKRPEWT